MIHSISNVYIYNIELKRIVIKEIYNQPNRILVDSRKTKYKDAKNNYLHEKEKRFLNIWHSTYNSDSIQWLSYRFEFYLYCESGRFLNTISFVAQSDNKNINFSRNKKITVQKLDR